MSNHGTRQNVDISLLFSICCHCFIIASHLLSYPAFLVSVLVILASANGSLGRVLKGIAGWMMSKKIKLPNYPLFLQITTTPQQSPPRLARPFSPCPHNVCRGHPDLLNYSPLMPPPTTRGTRLLSLIAFWLARHFLVFSDLGLNRCTTIFPSRASSSPPSPWCFEFIYKLTYHPFFRPVTSIARVSSIDSLSHILHLFCFYLFS